MSKLKFGLFLFLIIPLSACIPATPTPTEPPIETVVIQTEAYSPGEDTGPATQIPVTQEPIPTKLPPTESLATELPPTEEPACAKLISPENGLELPAVGKVIFAWEPVPGAESYLLNFILPNGEIVTFETDETTVDRYMEAFGMSGEFEWNVTVLDADGDEICTSIPFNFTKSDTPNQNNGDIDGGGGDDGPPGGGGVPGT